MEARREARQKYLESLKQQKDQQQIDPDAFSAPAPSTSTSGQSSKTDQATRRDKLLEEKRRAFFEKQKAPSATSDNNARQIGFQETKYDTPSIAPAAEALPSRLFDQLVPLNVPKLAEKATAPSEEPPNLSRWKSLGFPSEYAYAKSLGILNEKPKPNQNSIAPPSKDTFAALAVPSFPSSSGLTSFNLDGQSTAQAAVHLNPPSNTTFNTNFVSQPASTYDARLGLGGSSLQPQTQPFSLGLATSGAPNNFSLPSMDNNSQLKQQQQHQYADDLRKQMGDKDRVTRGSEPSQTTNSGNMFDSMGQYDLKEEKRIKQQQYAQQLEAQQRQQATNGNFDLHRSKLTGETSLQPSSLPVQNVSLLGSENLDRKQQQQQYANEIRQQMQVNQQQHRQQQQQSRQPPESGTGMMDVLGQRDTKEEKRRKQQEYAQQLDNQQNSIQSRHGQSAMANPGRDAFGTSAATVMGGGDNRKTGFHDGFGQQDSAEQKRLKQQLYAQQLQDAQQQQQKLAGASKPYPSNTNVSSHHQQQQYPQQNMFDVLGVKDTKEEKRLKQQQYAQDLDRQQQQKLQPAAGMAFPSSSSAGMPSQYSQQPNFAHGRMPQTGGIVGGGSGGGMLDVIGATDSKDEKRLKQQQYAQQLGSQQQTQQFMQQNTSSAYTANNPAQYLQQQQYQQPGGGSSLLDGFSSKDSKDEKRRKQQQYAQELERQQMQQQNLQHNAKTPTGNTAGDAIRGGLSSNYSSGNGGGSGNYNQPQNKRVLDKHEYARQLQEQMQTKQQSKQLAQQLEQQMHSPRSPTSSAAMAAAQAAGPGWEMGPLGIPVRKTLDVGNRGVQKQYNAQVLQLQQQLSPGKAAPSLSSMGVGMGVGMGSADSFDHPYAQQQPPPGMKPIPSLPFPQQAQQQPATHYDDLFSRPAAQMMGGGAIGSVVGSAALAMQSTAMTAGGVPGLGGNGDPFVDPAEQRRKQLRAEQATALALQIAQNKAQKEAEKEARKREEEEEWRRLEKEREQLRLAHEREAQDRQEKQRAADEVQSRLREELERQERIKEEEKARQMKRLEEHNNSNNNSSGNRGMQQLQAQRRDDLFQANGNANSYTSTSNQNNFDFRSSSPPLPAQQQKNAAQKRADSSFDVPERSRPGTGTSDRPVEDRERLSSRGGSAGGSGVQGNNNSRMQSRVAHLFGDPDTTTVETLIGGAADFFGGKTSHQPQPPSHAITSATRPRTSQSRAGPREVLPVEEDDEDNNGSVSLVVSRPPRRPSTRATSLNTNTSVPDNDNDRDSLPQSPPKKKQQQMSQSFQQAPSRQNSQLQVLSRAHGTDAMSSSALLMSSQALGSESQFLFPDGSLRDTLTTPLHPRPGSSTADKMTGRGGPEHIKNTLRIQDYAATMTPSRPSTSQQHTNSHSMKHILQPEDAVVTTAETSSHETALLGRSLLPSAPSTFLPVLTLHKDELLHNLDAAVENEKRMPVDSNRGRERDELSSSNRKTDLDKNLSLKVDLRGKGDQDDKDNDHDDSDVTRRELHKLRRQASASSSSLATKRASQSATSRGSTARQGVRRHDDNNDEIVDDDMEEGRMIDAGNEDENAASDQWLSYRLQQQRLHQDQQASIDDEETNASQHFDIDRAYQRTQRHWQLLQRIQQQQPSFSSGLPSNGSYQTNAAAVTNGGNSARGPRSTSLDDLALDTLLRTMTSDRAAETHAAGARKPTVSSALPTVLMQPSIPQSSRPASSDATTFNTHNNSNSATLSRSGRLVMNDSAALSTSMHSRARGQTASAVPHQAYNDEDLYSEFGL